MPHIILEHSPHVATTLPLLKILQDVSFALANIETFDIAAIKARAVPFSTYLVAGKGEGAQFVHLSVNIMTGRAPEILEKVRDTLFAVLEKQVKTVYNSEDYALTMEVREMNKDLYRK